MKNEAGEARPHDEVMRELMSGNIPHSEQEHAAKREIIKLRSKVDILEGNNDGQSA